MARFLVFIVVFAAAFALAHENAEKKDYTRELLSLDDAWKITEGDPAVVVAVIDTGVQWNHPDLAENIWVNERERAGIPGVDDDHNGYVDDVRGWDFVRDRADPADDHRHGSHVAGSIAAVRNGIGTIGLAPRVRIMALKAFDQNGNGSSEAFVEAVEYALRNGARIINNSSSGFPRSEALLRAVQKTAAYNALFVSSAGQAEPAQGGVGADNDSTPIYPASAPGALAVASSDGNNYKVVSSNYGPRTVPFLAPGKFIFSTFNADAWGYLSGTSMATPQVSATLALGVSLRPELTARELTDALCASSKKVQLWLVRCGRIDVPAFLALLQRH